MEPEERFGSQEYRLSNDIKKAVEAINNTGPSKPQAEDSTREFYSITGERRQPNRAKNIAHDATENHQSWLPVAHFWVQVALCLATLAAFVAAWRYANISARQKETMDQTFQAVFLQTLAMQSSNLINKSASDAANVENKRQSTAAEGQLTTMKQQFVIDQRPFIDTSIPGYFVDPITRLRLPGPVAGKPLGVALSLRNTGKSVARHGSTITHLVFGETQYREIRADPLDETNKGDLLSPGAPPTAVVAVTLKDTYNRKYWYLSEFQRDDFLDWDGSLPIVVFGRTVYEDAFGNRYCTPFVWSYVGQNSWARGSALYYRNHLLVGDIQDFCPAGTTM